MHCAAAHARQPLPPAHLPAGLRPPRCSDPAAYKLAEDICVQMGQYFQVRVSTLPVPPLPAQCAFAPIMPQGKAHPDPSDLRNR